MRISRKCCREHTERGDLLAREKSLGDLLFFQAAADKFEVDANLPAASDCIKGHSVRVGDVKANRIARQIPTPRQAFHESCSGRTSIPVLCSSRSRGWP